MTPLPEKLRLLLEEVVRKRNQTLNLYAYVENAPVNRADADGHREPQSVPEGCGNSASHEQSDDTQASCPHSATTPSDKTQPAIEMAQAQAQQVHASAEQASQPNDPNKGHNNQETNQKAAVIYGETSSLSPEVGKDGKADQKSASQLQDARENIADISERNKTVHSHKPSARELRNPQARKAWRDSQRAARASDGSKPGRYFFIRQAGEGPQHPSQRAGFGQGKPIQEYGPFRNAGGGDVPRGDQTYVDIYDK